MSGDTEKKEPQKGHPHHIKIRFSLRTKIIWLVIILVLLVVIVVYRTTLKDERDALTRQMQLRGGALAINLANNAQGALAAKLSEIAGAREVTRKDYNRIDYFELGLSENTSKMLKQEDVIYAFIANPFEQIIAHSDKNIQTLSELKLPSDVGLYKNLYKKGKVEPQVQMYEGKYMDPVSSEERSGRILDVAFPLKEEQEESSLKTYQGEVHIGMSEEGILKTIQEAKGKLLNVAFFSVFLGLGGAFLLALFITRPIKRLVGAMLQVAKGDLNQSVNIKSHDEIGLLAWSFNEMTEGLREKEKIKNTFNKFVSEDVATAVLANPDAMKLGGAYKEVTMLFSDIRNFTTISESMAAHEVVAMLNEYLTLMSDIIIKYKGVIDKYVGDEIMAVYGAPFEHENDPELAVRTAVEMMKVLEAWNAKRKEQGLLELQCGIGINSGQVIAGNMGSEKRVDYTVIGDNVNLASRLCDTAGKKGLHNIIVTESTYNLVKNFVIAKKVEPIYVKGKEKPIQIYELYDIKET
ncbi:MAG: HAMP domain-containing protein [Spirochaetes bacterium]|nr:HAMP domain-containing protein [Spirochaetota bacterium]